jgi:hypothetical protein
MWESEEMTQGSEGGDAVAHGGGSGGGEGSKQEDRSDRGGCCAQRWSLAAEGETHRELKKIRKDENSRREHEQHIGWAGINLNFLYLVMIFI